MHKNSKNSYQLLIEKKVQPFHKYCPAASRTNFNTSKFLLGAKVQNNAFKILMHLSFKILNLPKNVNSEGSGSS